MVDPNLKDANGNTPLHYALRLNQNMSTILVLCEYGANPRITNNKEISALSYAKSEGLKFYFDLLKKR